VCFVFFSTRKNERGRRCAAGLNYSLRPLAARPLFSSRFVAWRAGSDALVCQKSCTGSRARALSLQHPFWYKALQRNGVGMRPYGRREIPVLVLFAIEKASRTLQKVLKLEALLEIL